MRRSGLALLAALTLAGAGCGVRGAQRSVTTASAPQPQPPIPATPRPHPQVVEPTAGAAPSVSSAPPADSTPAGVSVGPPSGGTLPQPVSDSVVRQELAKSGLTANADQAVLTPDGLAIAPVGAPSEVQAIIAAGNQIARLPYRYGGGHATYEDTAYDCSGSISYVFGAAHLLSGSVTSGDLVNWGGPGPGKWITVFANAGHTFMYIAGLRFDTVALAETGSRWSARPADEGNLSSFAVRHPPGL